MVYSAGPMGPASLPARALLASLFALALLLPGIGTGYWGRDEAEYAGVAHAMNATGNYVVPRLFGRLYPDKPPLSEWLTAASFRVFGEGEASGRLPHVLLASGSAGLLLLLGSRLFDARTGTIASLLFSSSLLFVLYGRLLLTDSDLLFFTLLSILGLVVILEGRGRGWPILLAGVALGLAVLAKGPVAFLAPGLFGAGYLAGDSSRSARTLGRLLLAVAIALAVAAPWFWLAARSTGGEVLRAFWLRENVGRFLHPMEGHRGPVLYGALAVWLGFFPWTGLLVILPRRSLWRGGPARRGLLFWAGGVLLFFSVAATKLPHYLLPALPAVALLAAAEPRPSERECRAAAWATAATGVLLWGGCVVAVCLAAHPRAFSLLLPLGAAGSLALLLPLLVSDRRWNRLLPAAALFASAAVVLGSIPILDGLRSTNRLGSASRAARQPGEPLGGLRIQEAALAYYAGAERVEVWKTAAEVGRAAAESPTGSALVWIDSVDAVSLARTRRMSVRLLEEGASLADPRVRDALQLVRVRLARSGSGTGSS